VTARTEYPWMDSLMRAVDVFATVYAETRDPRCWLALDAATRMIETKVWDEVDPNWIAGIVAGIRRA